MEVITQRILKNNFEAFSTADIEFHIKHKYSKESLSKSEIVNLGVIKENPSTCRGVIEIMKYLNQYISSKLSGAPYNIICHGDQLSVERMVDAKLAMAASELPNDKMEGLIPRPQNFHKRCILMQDCMNAFFCGKSAASKGSLFQIKNKFGHRGVKKKVSDCVNQCVDLWNLTTEGYICLLACKLCSLSSLDECPEDLECRDIHVTEYVKTLSTKIVDTVWPKIDYNQCTGELDTTLPYTEVNETLAYWDDEDPERNSTSVDEEITDPAAQESSTSSNIDHVYEYSCAITWQGLKLMAERDAERENDGTTIISQWRIDMIDFWNNNHNKYLILGHRLLSGINGWLPGRIKEELIWNSTANLTGKEGGNLALDLVNEFLNNDFKTILKNCHGQYTDNQISRCSKIGGSLGKGVEDIFSSSIVKKYTYKSKSSDFSEKKNINKFISLYQNDHLFHRSGKGRCHKGFENMENKVNVKEPPNLIKR